MVWCSDLEYSQEELELLSAFVDCTVKNGKLDIGRGVNINKATTFFRNAVLDYSIPFYKVVGVQVKASGISNLKNVVSLIQGVECSYLQLIQNTEDVVCAGCGNEPMAGGVDTEFIQVRKPSELSIGYAIANYLNADEDGYLSSDSLSAPTGGLEARIGSAVRGIRLCKASNGNQLNLILARGIGEYDFDNTQYFLPRGFIPTRVVYDLGKYLSVIEAKPDSTLIELSYRTAINEEVLQQIIRDWARDIISHK